MTQFSLRLLICLVIFVATGCTKLSERTHARYEIGAPAKVRPAEPGGLYEIKWATAVDGPTHTLPGTQRLVRRGDPVGFARDRAGHVWAVAGQEKTMLSSLPAEAQICVWSTKVPKQTQFSKNAQVVANVAAAGVGLVALATLSAAEQQLERELYGDCDEDRGGHRYRKSDEDVSPRPAATADSRGSGPWSNPPQVP